MITGVCLFLLKYFWKPKYFWLTFEGMKKVSYFTGGWRLPKKFCLNDRDLAACVPEIFS